MRFPEYHAWARAEIRKLRRACVVLSLAVVALIVACWVVAHRYSPVIVVTHECAITASAALPEAAHLG